MIFFNQNVFDRKLGKNFLVANDHCWREKFISITRNQFSVGGELFFGC